MGTQVSEVKKILRQQMREAMAEMTEQEKAWSDQELVSAFLAHPKLDEANTVMLYYGVGQEIAGDGVPAVQVRRLAGGLAAGGQIRPVRLVDVPLGVGGGLSFPSTRRNPRRWCGCIWGASSASTRRT